MPEQTPEYGIPYLGSADTLKDTTDVAEASALAYEAELKKLNDRIASLEAGGGSGGGGGGDDGTSGSIASFIIEREYEGASGPPSPGCVKVGAGTILVAYNDDIPFYKYLNDLGLWGYGTTTSAGMPFSLVLVDDLGSGEQTLYSSVNGSTQKTMIYKPTYLEIQTISGATWGPTTHNAGDRLRITNIG